MTTPLVGLKKGHIRKNLIQSGEPQIFHFAVMIGVTCTFVLMQTVHIFILICVFTFCIICVCFKTLCKNVSLCDNKVNLIISYLVLSYVAGNTEDLKLFTL